VLLHLYNNDDDDDGNDDANDDDNLQLQTEKHCKARIHFFQAEYCKPRSSFPSCSVVSVSVEQAAAGPRRSELTGDKENVSYSPQGRQRQRKSNFPSYLRKKEEVCRLKSALKNHAKSEAGIKEGERGLERGIEVERKKCQNLHF
jgi:hypothetical protein